MVTLSSDVYDGYFGWKLVGGDANADAMDDLLVSASLWETLADVYLFLGPVTSDGERTDADAVLDGDTQNLGWDVDLVSDFDGDGERRLRRRRARGGSWCRRGVRGLGPGVWPHVSAGRDLHVPGRRARRCARYGEHESRRLRTATESTILAVGAPWGGNGTVYVVEGGGSAGTYANR
jgi:hypothetical protein